MADVIHDQLIKITQLSVLDARRPRHPPRLEREV